MKSTLLLVILSLSFFSISQDTLIYKNGEIKPTRIIALEKETNFVVHIIESDTIYTSLGAIERCIVYSSEIDPINTGKSTKFNVESDKVFISSWTRMSKMAKAFPKYQYGKFSIASNLTSLIDLQYKNSRITLEPEYRFNDYLSLKATLTLGLNTSVEGYGLRNESVNIHEWYFDRYNETYPLPMGNEYISTENNTPELKNEYPPKTFYKEKVVYSVGVHPKVYFFKKHKKPLSLYASAGVDIGQTNFKQTDRYHTMDTVYEFYQEYTDVSGYSEGYRYNWKATRVRSSETEYSSMFFRLGLGLGLDFNFSQYWAIGTEIVGFSTIITNQQNDKIYESVLGGDFETIFDDVAPTRFKGPNQTAAAIKFYVIFRLPQ